jgi:hypothetical protein
MNKYTYVEDYLEVIGGYKDPVTQKITSTHSFWFEFTPIISLARYDVNVLTSMCETAIANKALTARQGDLAVKIISKYQRQLAQKNIDIEPVLTPNWRHPLRVMDYTRKMRIVNDTILIEFPFKTELIEGLREFRKDSQGKGEWNKELRRWEFALTEYNLVYLKTWCEQNQFEIDDETLRLEALVAATERQGYAIELVYDNGAMSITNASATLIDYIEQHCGGMAVTNIAKLIDYAPILGYTVNQDLQDAWMQEHGIRILSLSKNKEVKIDPNNRVEEDDFASVLDYADLVGRHPVVVYEPSLSGKMLKALVNLRGENAVLVHKGKHSIADLDPAVKYIYTTVPIKNIKIPLMVSSAGMMFGGDKSLMVQNTDKAVYCTAEVYSNKKDHKVVDIEG